MRINVYRYDDEDGKILDGWFDPDKAELIEEGTRWDGNNHVSVHAVDLHGHQMLYRTPAGRWVLHTWSQRINVEPRYRFLADEQARQWLLINGSDEVLAEHFGEVEEERGPGRPEVGKAIHWRPGDELLARVDAEAQRRGRSRAVTLRELVAQALALSVEQAPDARARAAGSMPMHFRFRDVGGAVIEETLHGDDEWLVTAQFVSYGHDGGYVAYPGPWLLDALDGDRAEAQIVADQHLRQWCEKREQWVRDHPDEPMPKHLLGS